MRGADPPEAWLRLLINQRLIAFLGNTIRARLALHRMLTPPSFSPSRPVPGLPCRRSLHLRPARLSQVPCMLRRPTQADPWLRPAAKCLTLGGLLCASASNPSSLHSDIGRRRSPNKAGRPGSRFKPRVAGRLSTLLLCHKSGAVRCSPRSTRESVWRIAIAYSLSH